MSTKLTSLVALSVLALGAAQMAQAQNGVGPNKLRGSAEVVVDNGSSTTQFTPEWELSKRTIIYTFYVDLNQAATQDTVVYITDADGALHHPVSITFHAGDISKAMAIYGMYAPDADTLTAYNSWSSASMDVNTVLP